MKTNEKLTIFFSVFPKYILFLLLLTVMKASQLVHLQKIYHNPTPLTTH